MCVPTRVHPYLECLLISAFAYGEYLYKRRAGCANILPTRVSPKVIALEVVGAEDRGVLDFSSIVGRLSKPKFMRFKLMGSK